MKKLIALDLDGTLLDNHNQISEKTISYLKELISKGAIICVASGRPFRSITGIVSQISNSIPIIALNGAEISSIDQPLLNPLKKFRTKDFIKLFTENKPIIKSAFCSSGHHVFIYNRLAKLESFYHIDSNSIVIEKPFDEIKSFIAPSGALFVVESSKRGQFEAYIDKKLHHNAKYRLMGYDTKNAIYEISMSIMDKSFALKKLMKFYKIRKNNCIVIGDGENDIEMFKYADTSVAMKNANNLVKSKAKFVTEYDNNNDGVCEFLKTIIKEDI